MTQHTPGPWRFAEDLGEIQALGFENETLIAYPAVDTSNRFSTSAIFTPNQEEYHANGSLIAAAPELFECLQKALVWLDNIEETMDYNTFMDRCPNDIGRPQIRAVLNKAVGNA